VNGALASKPKIAILVAFHNRKFQTVECARRLDLIFRDSWDPFFCFTDDGSDDGTGDALLELGINCKFKKGDGSWYWAKSMAMAEKLIPKDAKAILWVNDDVLLHEFTETSNFLMSKLASNSVYVGFLGASSNEEAVTYGPLRLKGKHPLKLEDIEHVSSELADYDTFNGNFVFLPNHIWEKVGVIDSQFAHGFADLDYGFRVKEEGFLISNIPFVVGICDRNKPNVLSLSKVLKNWNHPKVLPVSSNLRFLRKHGGFWWPIFSIRYFLGLSRRILNNR